MTITHPNDRDPAKKVTRMIGPTCARRHPVHEIILFWLTSLGRQSWRNQRYTSYDDRTTVMMKYDLDNLWEK